MLQTPGFMILRRDIKHHDMSLASNKHINSPWDSQLGSLYADWTNYVSKPRQKKGRGLWPRKIDLSPQVKYFFTDRSKAVLLSCFFFFFLFMATETAASSSYLDCYLCIDNGKLATRLYYKRDDFNFPISIPKQ